MKDPRPTMKRHAIRASFVLNLITAIALLATVGAVKTGAVTGQAVFAPLNIGPAVVAPVKTVETALPSYLQDPPLPGHKPAGVK